MTQKTVVDVLLVDDNDVMRTVLRGILVGDVYRMAGEANNGETALELALRLKPDLICLDIEMPKINGIEVLKQVKESLPLTAVVMVTGSIARETVQAAIAGGADGYIVKPFNTGRVFAAVDAAVAKMRAKKQAASKQPPAAAPAGEVVKVAAVK